MSAKIKHLAIISDNYALLSRFYEALFGMRTSKSPRAESAVAIGDGYLGMNIIPQKLGRQAGLEHFGLEVEDTEEKAARLDHARYAEQRRACGTNILPYN